MTIGRRTISGICTISRPVARNVCALGCPCSGTRRLAVAPIEQGLRIDFQRFGDPHHDEEAALRKHTRLEINRRLLDTHSSWTDESIIHRASELYEVARTIWPR